MRDLNLLKDRSPSYIDRPLKWKSEEKNENYKIHYMPTSCIDLTRPLLVNSNGPYVLS